jgi:hypothetical protein
MDPIITSFANEELSFLLLFTISNNKLSTMELLVFDVEGGLVKKAPY